MRIKRRRTRSDRSERRDDWVSTCDIQRELCIIVWVHLACGFESIRHRSSKGPKGQQSTHILRLPPVSVVTFTNLKNHIPSEICFDGIKAVVHSPAVVQETLLSTALWRFLLLLLLYFGCLRFNLTGSGERSVNCTPIASFVTAVNFTDVQGLHTFAHVDSVL
ncbi:hypothetical protein M404DRAFT_879324 [Pisolithus tinctorius Marx 270]|uniref:Uncharacterized protein n=1 Tax=Pisolithus tinctorius Marx 270 TaxID=870435 RepID=A0A0C3KMR1_PISTI|nr:hypothetical protein M404DRAFT_879324 [Pisolithus tinctorius Marx 270]